MRVLSTGHPMRFLCDVAKRDSGWMTDMNLVQLQGRVAAPAQERILPSGDAVTSFRVIVPRAGSALRRSKQKVDTIECSAWTARLRRAVAKLQAGDEVAISGQLRRSFRRNGPITASFVSVDVEQCDRLTTR
jgi:single-strand DNA-binding protein